MNGEEFWIRHEKIFLLTLSLSVFAFIIFAKITPNDVRAFPSRQSPPPPPGPPQDIPLPIPEPESPREEQPSEPQPPPPPPPTPTPTPCIPNWCFVQQTICCFDPMCIFLGQTNAPDTGVKNRCNTSPTNLNFLSRSPSQSLSIFSRIILFLKSL